MATEVSCGQCRGRLLVETLGVVVACPHCGTHLSIPAPAPEPIAPPVLEPSPPPSPPSGWTPPAPPNGTAPAVEQFVAVTVSDLAAPEAVAEDPNAVNVLAGADEPGVASPIGWHSTPNLHLAAETKTDSSVARPHFATPEVTTSEVTASEPEIDLNAAATDVSPADDPSTANAQITVSSTQMFSLTALTDQLAKSAEAAPPEPAATVTTAPLTFGAAPAAPAPAPPAAASGPLTFGAAPAPASPSPVVFGAAPATTPVFTAPAAPGLAAISEPAPIEATTSVAQEAADFAEEELLARQKFLLMLLIIVGSYASAVTIVLVYWLIFGQASTLESLPDLVPPVNKNGDIGLLYNAPKNNVPMGHVLSLGQSRRFGNVKVTPLKVTRGVLTFDHFSGKAGLGRDTSAPLLKLWVKFENVSRDQTFAPLDSHVLFRRDVRNLGETIWANGFVARESDRRAGKTPVYLYDLSVTSEFRIVGQHLNQQLEPRETVESFVPSQEEAVDLSGDLVWRFQFRKGYNPASGRGVTTLIDVRFNSKDITNERA